MSHIDVNRDPVESAFEVVTAAIRIYAILARADGHEEMDAVARLQDEVVPERLAV